MNDEKNTHDEDIVPLTEELDEIEEEGEERLEDKIASLRKKLKSAESEKTTNLDGWQRERADFLNYKRRITEDKEREKEQILSKVIEKLLPFCDSFELAIKSIEADPASHMSSGLQGIASQLNQLLKDYGVIKILPTIGTPFDPLHHEALSNVPVSDASSDGTIQAVVQGGYALKESIIRPARVIVGEYKK